MFSGGEPFANPSALRYGLEACRQAGRVSVICTSAYWARTEELADQFLARFPPASALWISTDTFHEEFVPLVWLRNAARCARRRDLEVAFQLVERDEEPNSEFAARFRAALGNDLDGEQVYVAPLSVEGRARTELRPDERPAGGGSPRLDEVPDGPCPWLGAPWLHEDGALCACPNLEVHAAPSHPLKTPLQAVAFDALSASMNEDGFIQALRVFGPRGIVDRFPVAAWGWDASSFQGRTICDLCHSLARTPRVVAGLRNDEVLRPRLKGLRAFFYGEHDSPAHLK
jgi:hypothetical protein